MTDGPIRSSGQPGKTELRVCEILDSWPNISEVSNKERDSEDDNGFKNGLQIIILAKNKKENHDKLILSCLYYYFNLLSVGGVRQLCAYLPHPLQKAAL